MLKVELGNSFIGRTSDHLVFDICIPKGFNMNSPGRQSGVNDGNPDMESRRDDRKANFPAHS